MNYYLHAFATCFFCNKCVYTYSSLQCLLRLSEKAQTEICCNWPFRHLNVSTHDFWLLPNPKTARKKNDFNQRSQNENSVRGVSEFFFSKLAEALGKIWGQLREIF